ncbi:MAG: HD domain-containing protein [Patescibacteria group bacterium]
MLKENISEIVEGLLKLQKKYSSTPRSIVTYDRNKNIIESGLLKEYNYDSEIIREPLIEHVGHLPIIASYLHQFIEHKNKVDLGKSLIILSVHDIGETEVGDMITYSKTKSHEKAEEKAAFKILPDYLYKYFIEYDEAKTIDAKFAKSVDSLAPLLHELTLPKITAERFKYHNFSVDKIVVKKKVYFKWDNVLSKIFDYVTDELRKIEK